MKVIITDKWKASINERLNDHHHVTVTSQHSSVIQYLVILFSGRELPYKIYNLGAGVKKITTETDICPCCKRSLT